MVRTVSAILLCLALLLASADCGKSDESPQDGQTADTTAPSAPTNLTKTTPNNDSTPTFTWDAATDDDSGVDYYLVTVHDGGAGSSIWGNIGNVTTHTVDTAVSDGSHTIELKAVDGAGNEGTVAGLDFTCDTTPPSMSSVGVLVTWPSSATVTWTTNEPAVSEVQYGTTAAYGSSEPAIPFTQDSYVLNHGINLTDMTASATYHYQVRSIDRCGNEAVSGDYVFSVPSAPDTAPPTISGMSVSSLSSSTATFMWMTDEDATSEVEYGTTTSYGLSSTLDGSLVTTHQVTLTGLTSGTAYHYRAKSRDACGNEASSDDHVFNTAQAAQALEIVSHSSYVSSIGMYHVVGEVRNNSSNNLEVVKITATFYNSVDVVIASDFAYVDIDILVPNQRSPFEVMELDTEVSAQVDHYSLAVSDYDATEVEPYRDLTLLTHSSSVDGLGCYHVVGEIRNTGNQAVTYAQVVGTFYDSTAKVVADEIAFTSPSDLAAGQTALFELVVSSGAQSAKISIYELQVQA